MPKRYGRGNPKLTEEQVVAFLKRYDAGELLMDLANEANVSAPSLSTRIKKARQSLIGQGESLTNKAGTREKQEKRALDDRIEALEFRLAQLELSRQPQRRNKASPAPRRQAILAVLKDDPGTWYNYQELAEEVGCSVAAVKGAVNGAPAGMFDKATHRTLSGNTEVLVGLPGGSVEGVSIG